ncbi:diguanylate cyclase [Cellvibrio sp. NN19]|uniref:GGDEF domain-containing protein n=1 Tax=Cellvibrio chitinivorans TaxID=3102792 RepID=UPI002B405354|nr:diguanylate cyclase [Cellvibrio sp. NN19]
MVISEDLSGILKNVHWQMDILQHIDVGLVVMTPDYKIEIWNSFMQNHSGKAPEDVLNKTLFEVFPELSEQWFRHKSQPVFILQNTVFTTWEQRPYLFRFPHYRPITGTAEYMYQNSTIIPLVDTKGAVSHICLIIYDVTDSAVNKIAQQQANKQLQTLSRTDHLTGLFNRGYWEYRLIKEFRRYDRYEQSSSLIMLDIDHFKKINDKFGHTIGDEAIRGVSRAIKEQVRDLDVAGRYGGEEFGIILTNTNGDGACVFAERLREAIEKLTIFAEGHEINFTVSLGVAELDNEIHDHRAWIEKADHALYKSKENGRNCCTLFS